MYWDANASSQLRPVAREAAMEFLAQTHVSNPSSVHAEGRQARALLRKSREQILNYLGLSVSEVELCFMSGGTEACNSLVHGFCPPAHTFQRNTNLPHILTTAIEHAAMLEPIKRLEREGYEVHYIPPDMYSNFRIDDFTQSIRKETELVSLMLANNETGLILPLVEIVSALRTYGYQGAIVCDASQAISKSGVLLKDLFDAGIDAIAISAHKMGALPGSGAVLFSKNTCRMYDPLLLGGSQEGKKRGGTEFVLGTCVWGAVAEHLVSEGETERAKRREARDLLFQLLQEGIPDSISHTPFDRALDNTILLQVPDCRGDDLVVALDLEGVSISIGAACSSGKQDVSHVLLAMGLNKKAARECVRISLDWDVTHEQIKKGAEIFISIVHRMREMSGKSAATQNEEELFQ